MWIRIWISKIQINPWFPSSNTLNTYIKIYSLLVTWFWLDAFLVMQLVFGEGRFDGRQTRS
jgi:hypothetical protein